MEFRQLDFVLLEGSGKGRSELTVHLCVFCVLTSRESFLVLCFVTRTFRLASLIDSIRVGTLHSEFEVVSEIRE